MTGECPLVPAAGDQLRLARPVTQWVSVNTCRP